jgi:sulfatase modifying factor 1
MSSTESHKSSIAKNMAPPTASRVACVEPTTAPIPSGYFLMGCAAGRDDEKPVHRVWVDAFEMAVCQVTRTEYARFLAATHRIAPPFWDDANFQDPRQPVVGPSWFDTVAYCEWLSSVSSRLYRLPTEAEWEWAAHGGREAAIDEGAIYPWGNAPPESLPEYSSRWKNGPEPVARFAPNGFGLFNMGDNVHEWCADWYDAHYYERSPERNPPGPPSGARRASRGGAWRHQIKVARCAARSSIPPEFKYSDYGFRVVRSCP